LIQNIEERFARGHPTLGQRLLCFDLRGEWCATMEIAPRKARRAAASAGITIRLASTIVPAGRVPLHGRRK
jgi:hypothetical protein